MKMKKLLLAITPMLLLTSCFGGMFPNSSDPNNPDADGYIKELPFSIDGATNGGTGGGDGKVLSIENAPIFHAWDWKISDIKMNLNDIAAANYKAIQLSPLHPSKNIFASEAWWNLYQPMGFKVAEGNENPLGTKTELTELCTMAEAKGIKIVMDVVCNHLAQGDNYYLFTNGADDWSGYKTVRDFEQEICDQNLIHPNYSKSDEASDDSNNKRIIQGSLGGLPDLRTEDQLIQDRVKSMLKEYIDCGVKGFRFDAAKHIETPSDGDFASDFWPEVIGYIEEYGLAKYGEKPYSYGEILYNPGHNRNWNYYTPYMGLVASTQGKNIMDAVVSNDVNKATFTNYDVDTTGGVVLWSESHDTWAHTGNFYGKTNEFSNDKVNLAYAIQVSRKDCAALYFSRPKNPSSIDNFPQVQTNPEPDYKSPMITGVNKFHNDFVNGTEQLSVSDSNAFINVRKTSNNEGALIANLAIESSLSTVYLSGLSDGTYTDIISNSTYTVQDGVAHNVSLTKGVCVLEKNPDANPVTPSSTNNTPYLTISADKATFENTLQVKVTANSATESYVKFNDKGWVKFDKEKTVTIGEGMPDGNIEVIVAAKNDNGISAYSRTFVKETTVVYEDDVVLENVPVGDNVYAWVWKGDGAGHWEEMTRKGNNLVYNVKADEDSIIFVKFPEDYVPVDSGSWAAKTGQTGNLAIATKVFTYNL